MSRPRFLQGDLRQGVECLVWGYWWQPKPDLSDCLARRDPDRPWLLEMWEPLHTKAPSPARVRPYCCYVRTVIFHARPYMPKGNGYPWKSDGRWHYEHSKNALALYDKVESRLQWDDVIAFDGQEWIVSGGLVVWARKRWWMHRQARRTVAE